MFLKSTILTSLIALLIVIAAFLSREKYVSTNTVIDKTSPAAVIQKETQKIPEFTTKMSTAPFTAKSILRSFVAREQSEGVGAVVRRSIGTMQARNFSPFLMLDHFRVGKGAGFPDHPHRGQETVTYMLKGYMDHEDFTGSAGTIGPGDLQFMTAGRGVVHAEMPRSDDGSSGSGVDPEGMQLWVDLPAPLKHCEPRYRDLMSPEVPIAKPNDDITVRVISGKSYGIDSVQDLAYTPLWYLDFSVKPGATVEQQIPEGFNTFLYIISGGLEIADKKIPTYSCVLFKQDGNGVKVSVPKEAEEDARFVLIAGQELHQEIVQHGPFVETSKEAIYQAFMDYQAGANGFERAVNWESKIAKKNQAF